MFYSHTDHFDMAKPYLHRSLSGVRRFLAQHPQPHSEEHLGLISETYQLVSFAYSRQGIFKDATVILEESYNLLRKHSPESVDAATTAQDLAVVLSVAGQYDQAETLFTEAIHILSKGLPIISEQHSTLKNSTDNEQWHNIVNAFASIKLIPYQRATHNFKQMKGMKHYNKSCIRSQLVYKDLVKYTGYELPVFNCKKVN